MTRILLVEDEDSLRKLIKMNLELEGYEIYAVSDGANAIQAIESQHFDLVILDLMLPKISGMDVLKNLRLRHDKLPVIIVSAKDTSTDRITGLKTGADDYLTKPFEIEELQLRIEKLIERKSDTLVETAETERFTFGDCTVNFRTFEVEKSGQSFQLGQKEIMILKHLINNRNAVVSRQEILRHVWGYDVFPSTRTIDNFIASLRKQLEDNPRQPRYIISIRGVGYKFAIDE